MERCCFFVSNKLIMGTKELFCIIILTFDFGYFISTLGAGSTCSSCPKIFPLFPTESLPIQFFLFCIHERIFTLPLHTKDDKIKAVILNKACCVAVGKLCY
jgi:hypothetical protein